MTHAAGISTTPVPPPGHWVADGTTPAGDAAAFRSAVGNLRAPVIVVDTGRGLAVASGGRVELGGTAPAKSLPVAAYLPPLPPEQLGDPTFREDHALKYPYMTGAMANGIGSAEIVEVMSRAGMLGSFGAAGLSLDRITAALDRIQPALGDAPYCVNLIHSPGEPVHEMATAELLMK